MRLRIRRAREDDAGAVAAVLSPLIEAGIYTALDAPIAAAEQAAFIRASWRSRRTTCSCSGCRM